MKAQKTVLRTVYCLAGLLFIVSVGYNIFQHQQFRKFKDKPVSDKIAKTESVDKSSSVPGSVSGKAGAKIIVKGSGPDGKVEKNDTGEINDLEYHLNAAKEELDMTNEQLTEELSKKEEFKKAYYQTGRSNSDPVAKKIHKDNAIKRTNEDYDPLFNKLNITEEEFDELKGILLDKEMELYELMNIYSNASDGEEKEKVNQQTEEVFEKYKDKIHEFLGEEQNEVYQAYEDRLYERNRLDNFMAGLAPDNKINEEQTERLIESMYEGRKAVYDEVEADKNDEDSSSGITEEKIVRSMATMSRVNEKYVEACSGIMTPDQLEKYKTYLKQQLEMQEASMKMSLYLNDDK